MAQGRATTVADDIEAFFAAAVRARGEDYVARRRVLMLNWTADAISAIVRGTRDYLVLLGRTPPGAATADLSCTCPYYRDTAPCKHMWAFARVVDTDPRWAESWGASPITVDVESAALDLLDEPDDDIDAMAGFEDGGPSGPPKPAALARGGQTRDDVSRRMRDYWASRMPATHGRAAPTPGHARTTGVPKAKPGPDSEEVVTRACLQRIEHLQPALQRGVDTVEHAARQTRRTTVGVKSTQAGTSTIGTGTGTRTSPTGTSTSITTTSTSPVGTTSATGSRTAPPADGSVSHDAPATPDADPPVERLFLIDAPASRAEQQLVLHVATRERLEDGSWAEPEPETLSPMDLPSYEDDPDHDLLALLVAVSAQQIAYYGGYVDGGPLAAAHANPYANPYASRARGPGRGPARVFAQGDSPLRVPIHFHRAIVSRLCATRRCYLLVEKPAPEFIHLTWNPTPWTVGLAIVPETREDSASVLLTARLAREGASRGNQSGIQSGNQSGIEYWGDEDVHLVLSTGLVFAGREASPVAPGSGLAWLLDMRGAGHMRIPRAHLDRVLAAVLESPGAPPVSTPAGLDPKLAADLAVEHLRPAPSPVLTLRVSRYVDARLHAELAFDYGGARITRGDQRGAVLLTNPRRLIHRDPHAEADAERQLEAHGVRVQREGPPGLLRIDVTRKKLIALVQHLAPAGWRIEVEGRPYRVAGRTSIDISSGIDWFDIGGTVDFDGVSMALPELLAAVKHGDATVVLADGSLGMVPEAWRATYGALSAFARTDKSAPDDRALRVSASQMSLVDALLADREDVTWDARASQIRDRLARFTGIAPADAPPTFTGTLREYQREGLGWLRSLADLRLGGCLADDMGLGKTVMVLALLDGRRDAGPSLVVMPRSVIFNWQQEAARFAPGLRVLDYSGAGRTTMSADDIARANIVLTTYGTVRRDAGRLAEMTFDYVVLDEAQAIKNAGTVSARAARTLKGRHRLALSGTPVENHIGELWSLFEFLNPGLLGSAERGLLSRVRAGDPGAITTLRHGLRPFILRRTKAQVAPELPPRSEETIVCELDAVDRKHYDELRDHYRAAILGLVDRQGLKRSRFQVLEALLRLRQAACHVGLVDPRRRAHSSAKLEALGERLDEVIAEGHKALVFSQFTSLLALAQPLLRERGIVFEHLDGQTRDRDARVRRFQGDEACPVFLISLKAGGLGLNLTAADYVFLLDPWWNPAVEAQAIDRAHRIGQSRPVFAYRLIAKDTVEERILELQDRKRALADAIITADNGALSDLTREDLERLLS